MAARHRPTSDDRRSAIDIALSGLARGDDLADLAERLEPLHPRNDTFPGEVLVDLAAGPPVRSVIRRGQQRQSRLSAPDVLARLSA